MLVRDCVWGSGVRKQEVVLERMSANMNCIIILHMSVLAYHTHVAAMPLATSDPSLLPFSWINAYNPKRNATPVLTANLKLITEIGF